MEPVCHVEGWGGARSLVCTPTSTRCPQHRYTHVHAQSCTCLHNTHVHTRGEMGRLPTGLTVSHGGGGGNGVRQVWLQSPSPSWRRESRSASWRRWPELSLQRPVESSGKGSAGDTLGCFLVGGHMLLFGMSRKLVGSRVS